MTRVPYKSFDELSDSQKLKRLNPEASKRYSTTQYEKHKEVIRARDKERRKDKTKYYAGYLLETINTNIEAWCKYKIITARAGAKKRGIPFNIVAEDILKLIVKECPILKIELDYTLHTSRKSGIPNFNKPSIDRIDNTKGYEPDNIILTSLAYNIMKNRLSVEELVKYSKSIIKFYEVNNV